MDEVMCTMSVNKSLLLDCGGGGGTPQWQLLRNQVFDVGILLD